MMFTSKCNDTRKCTPTILLPRFLSLAGESLCLRKNITLSFLAVLFFSLHSSRAFPGTSCTYGTNGQCSIVVKRRVEYPAGAIDGANRLFTLSAEPSPGSIRLTVNGMFVEEGVAFTYSGTVITMTPSSVPPLDAVLLASYLPGNPATSTAPLIAEDKTRSLVRQALLESLLSEEQTVASISSTSKSSHDMLARGARRETTEQQVSSLSLLTRTLNKHGNGALSSTITATGFLNSFEGIGDQAVASPYSVLLGTRSSGLIRGGNALGTNLRSVSLLQQRLDDSEIEDNTPRPGGKR